MLPTRTQIAVGMLVLIAALNGVIADEPVADPQSWSLVKVPGTWTTAGDEQLKNHGGFAWYRCYVKAPDSWRDHALYADSLVLSVNQVAGAHEAYVNGTKIGGAGTMPPQFQSGVEEVRRHKIPADLLQKGVHNVIALRIFSGAQPGGFLGAAPVISSYEHEIKLAGDWEFRTGDDPAWASKPPTTTPAAALFDHVDEASFELAPTAELVHGDALSPAEALATMKAASDLALDQVLSDPEIAQPLFMHFDERGRMWVVEYRQYPYPAGLKILGRNKYYRMVYDKVPPPPPHHTPGADVISIHEDSDGDGTFDRHKKFIDGLNIATSVAHGRGGVWVLQPPYLLFYPDANRDDVPDGDPLVHLSGFGLEDTHSATNSLAWGPDGWLYSTQGCNTVAHITVLGQTKPSAMLDGPGVWRYHPETHRFEVFGEGGGNAFGMEIDSQGRIFSGHNGGNTRGFYYVQGGYYDKGAEAKFMPVSNPYAFGTLPMMAHAPVPRFTHAFIRYEGGTLPTPYHDKLFSVDPLNHNVMVSAITPRGASFGTEDLPPALSSPDRAFRPVAITVGPDGGVYVADLYEYYIAHGQHYQGQIDPTTGRIYRLRAKEAAITKAVDLQQKSADELVDLLSHTNKWHRQTALRLLADRRDRAVLPRLRRQLNEETGQLALESLWALYQLGGFDDTLAATTLRHGNASVRTWTIRLLGDAGRVSPPIAAQLVELSQREMNPEFLCQLAATARRLPATEGLPIVRNLIKHDGLEKDPYLPLMIWWAIESKCDQDRKAVVALFCDSESDPLWNRALVSQHLATHLIRRFALAGTREDLLACARLLQAAPDDALGPLVQGFELAFKGRSFGSLPDELIAQLKRTKLAESLAFRARSGDPAAIDEALRQLASDATPLPLRLELAEVFCELDHSPSVPVLLKLFEASVPDSLRIVALTALGRRTDDSIGTAVVSGLGKATPDVQAAAHTLLASRPAWTLSLLQAVADGHVPKSSIPGDLVRQMLLHSEPRIAELIASQWGDIHGSTSDELRQQIQSLAQKLSTGIGNPYTGRKLFETSCGKCHSLFGLGGKIGPDLTPLKRDDVSAMLLNIVNPGVEIREGFETYVAITSDGQVVTGFLVEQGPQLVALRTQDGQTIRLPREEIEELKKSTVSIMPENLLKDLSEQELRDLFAYLRSSQPGR